MRTRSPSLSSSPAAAALTSPCRRLPLPCRVRLAASCTQLYAASAGWFLHQPIRVGPRQNLEGLAAHARWLRRVAGEGAARGAACGALAPVPDALQPTLPHAAPVEVSFEFYGPRVLDALNTLRGVNVQRVDAARCGLAAVPEALEGMESVASLELSGNPIERGWERLRSLRQLRELDLRNCDLTELPPALAGMESMTRLGLRLNPIEHGWERLRTLRQMGELNPAGCGLTELPAALVGMSMTRLDFGWNHTMLAWERLGSLRQLRVLDLWH